MNAVATRRWTDGETVWFAVSGIGPELADAAPRLLMDYEHAGQEWRHGYPAAIQIIRVAGTPRLYTPFRARSVVTGKLLLTVSPGVQAYDFTFG